MDVDYPLGQSSSKQTKKSFGSELISKVKNKLIAEPVEESALVCDKKDRPLSQYEIEKADLESAPVIPRSEHSPATFIFAQTDEEK